MKSWTSPSAKDSRTHDRDAKRFIFHVGHKLSVLVCISAHSVFASSIHVGSIKHTGNSRVFLYCTWNFTTMVRQIVAYAFCSSSSRIYKNICAICRKLCSATCRSILQGEASNRAIQRLALHPNSKSDILAYLYRPRRPSSTQMPQHPGMVRDRA